MYKSTRYEKIDCYCEACDCDPCDCDGVWDEFRILGTDAITKTRQVLNLVSWKDRLASFSLVQVEGRIIEPKNRIFLPSMQGDLPSKEGAHRANDTRGSERNGD
jgi:hypothetical protein